MILCKRGFNYFVLFGCGMLLSMIVEPIQAQNPDSSQASWEHEAGAWRVRFVPESAMLRCEHPATGAVLSGVLSFSVEENGNTRAWRVASPRDSIVSRLALLDTAGDVQGYVTFRGEGDSLQICPIHRAAQNYSGTLVFEADVRLGGQTFACRTRPPDAGQVVQMASGAADSGLNDSLFDRALDMALCFQGNAVSIRTVQESNSPAFFRVRLSALPSVPAHATLGIELIKDYYRSRYVPHYRPIDKERCPKAPTGWMSWNVYFDTAGEKENLAEAGVAARYLRPYGMEIFSIESWQDNSPELPVSKFYNLTLRPDPNKFPSGMKWLADQIRDLGFKPGIWTVPFGTGDSAFYEAHRSWFLHDKEGRPMQNWCGLYLLDPSQEEVIRHMEETHRIMSLEWGYEYFKIDGMSGRNSGYSAHAYEREDIRAAFKDPSCEDPFLRCVQALRRGIGPDRIWLACQGHYTGPEIGYADAGRIGADIVAHRRPPDWTNYLNQARTTLNQLFVNNIVWYGDPDTLLVGSANSIETVRLAACVVALSGQAMFAGDKLAELPLDRMRLLQQCLPVCDIAPLDLYPIFDMVPVWDLKIRRSFGAWDVVSLFNWGEQTADRTVQCSELGLEAGLSYLVYDCWNRSLQRGVRESITVPVPGHGNALLAVYPELSRPQVVYSDRHIVQGGIGLEGVSWDETSKRLSGVIALVGGDPTQLEVAVPEGYVLQSAGSENGASIEAKAGDGVVLLTIQRDAGGPASWSMQF